MKPRHRARRVVNWVTLGTPLGLAVALSAGCAVRRGPRGLLLAVGYHRRLPQAAAFTLGNVIVVRDPRTAAHPAVMAHEERHATQWAMAGGVVGFPIAYGVAAAWSFLRAGDYYSRNVFELSAGLADGGYPDPTRTQREPTSGERR